MYLYLGQKTAINDCDIIGVFDLDTATVKKPTREFLKNKEKEGKTTAVIGDDLPKSFILVNKDGGERVYISQIAPATVLKRLTNANLDVKEK